MTSTIVTLDAGGAHISGEVMANLAEIVAQVADGTGTIDVIQRGAVKKLNRETNQYDVLDRVRYVAARHVTAVIHPRLS